MAQPRRPRVSLKVLLAGITIVAFVLGGWIAYANFKTRSLTDLRQQGEIVTIRHDVPDALRSIGVNQLGPVTKSPTVELYITPKGDNALIADSEDLVPKAEAARYVLEMADKARRNGAKDIQLILIDSFDSEWTRFANDNSLTVIGENRERYLMRLKANRESGAHINPQSGPPSAPQ